MKFFFTSKKEKRKVNSESITIKPHSVTDFV